jgi:hypothetical protein
MRVFKYRKFQKWMKAEKILDSILIEAISEINDGLFDTNLGGGLYKKRIVRQGRGRRSGYRVLLAFQRQKKFFFIYGFAKNEIDNINDKAKEVYQRLGQYYLSLTDEQLVYFIKTGELIEVVL